MKTLFFGLFVIVLLPNAIAQDFVSGIVQDEFEFPLEGAEIYWQEDPGYKVYTNTEGEFKIALLDQAKNLVVRYSGFSTYRFEATSTQQDYIIELSTSENLAEVVLSIVPQTTFRKKSSTINSLIMHEDELKKAACCNLSESFETNATVDVRYSDAILGSRQVNMLGLNSPYLYASKNSLPIARGASQAFGLAFIPGTWVDKIEVTSGVNSVADGFEAIAGQIDVSFKEPDPEEPLFVNIFASEDARFEANVHFNQKVAKDLNTSLFIHGSTRTAENDRNKDQFLDSPIGEQLNLLNSWSFTPKESNLRGQLNLNFVNDRKQSGEVGFSPSQHQLGNEVWGAEIKTQKMDVDTDWLYQLSEENKSFFEFKAAFRYHDQESYYGQRSFDIEHKHWVSKLTYETLLPKTEHRFLSGIQYMRDDFEEVVDFQGLSQFSRTDHNLGGFAEYTHKFNHKLSLTSGIRLDYHNQIGVFALPKMHLKYQLFDQTLIKASAGRGRRIANVFAENQRFMASNRSFTILSSNETNNGKIYGLEAEDAWTFGINIQQDFEIFERCGELIIDAYSTQFSNQVVVDLDQSAQQVVFYNLEGKSFSNILQIDVNYNLIDHLNFRGSYKHYQVKTDFISGRLFQPLQPENRAFVNLSYQLNNKNEEKTWKFDATYNWTGKQRLPFTSSNSEVNQLAEFSKPFSTVNTQITKLFSEKFEVYLGLENVFNYQQENPILGADDPFGSEFDASLIYAPIFGRMLYVGLRYSL